jgi:hypothetical protein
MMEEISAIINNHGESFQNDEGIDEDVCNETADEVLEFMVEEMTKMQTTPVDEAAIIELNIEEIADRFGCDEDELPEAFVTLLRKKITDAFKADYDDEIKHAFAEWPVGELANLFGNMTTNRFWDCNCEKDYIHPAEETTLQCFVCGALRVNQPDSMMREVIRAELL